MTNKLYKVKDQIVIRLGGVIFCLLIVNICCAQVHIENLSIKETEFTDKDDIDTRLFIFWENIIKIVTDDNTIDYKLISKFANIESHPTKKNHFIVQSNSYYTDSLIVMQGSDTIFQEEFRMRSMPKIKTYILKNFESHRYGNNYTKQEILADPILKVWSYDFVLPNDLQIVSFNIDLFAKAGNFILNLGNNGAVLSEGLQNNWIKRMKPGKTLVFNQIIATYSNGKIVQLPPMEIVVGE